MINAWFLYILHKIFSYRATFLKFSFEKFLKLVYIARKVIDNMKWKTNNMKSISIERQFSWSGPARRTKSLELAFPWCDRMFWTWICNAMCEVQVGIKIFAVFARIQAPIQSKSRIAKEMKDPSSSSKRSVGSSG